VTYYSRGTGPAYWDQLFGLPFQCLGVDWRQPLPEVLERYADRWAIQGNVDPEWLHLPGAELELRLREYFAAIRKLPAELRRGWVCGLGHGILQRTPEDNVRRFVALQREIFG
jgi:uroporphyrinogen decarboxylase